MFYVRWERNGRGKKEKMVCVCVCVCVLQTEAAAPHLTPHTHSYQEENTLKTTTTLVSAIGHLIMVGVY